jgi:hypothetical protein
LDFLKIEDFKDMELVRIFKEQKDPFSVSNLKGFPIDVIPIALFFDNLLTRLIVDLQVIDPRSQIFDIDLGFGSLDVLMCFTTFRNCLSIPNQNEA